uniref:FAD-binding oxidoreductase n=1 Tax=Pseudooceanicola nanhaiensis TaxID=375761 RepID=UPI0030095B1D
MLDDYRAIVGEKYLLTGEGAARWTTDATGKIKATPLAVARPADTAEVAALVTAANAAGQAIVPAGGLTGLTGATAAEGALVISLDRMNAIREIRQDARSAVVEAGVVLTRLHEAVEDRGLSFPLTFGARGSCMVGGFLSTNAGGSNVLRYGNTRDLGAALKILNAVQEDSGGAVEACEYMPGDYVENYAQMHPEHGMPFDTPQPVNVLMELGSTVPRDSTPGPDGEVPLVARFEAILGRFFEEGLLLDAVVAQSEAQRRVMWARREAAAEVAGTRSPRVTNDVAVEVDRMDEFITRADAVLARVDPGAGRSIVAHLGDGNIHYTVWPGSDDPLEHDRMVEAIEDIVVDMRGSFSAEHGI